MSLISLTAVAWMFAIDARGATEFSGPTEPPGAHPCTATLIADVANIRPGEPFFLGVHLQLQPAWHVYWHSPRDAGDATRVEWKLPSGFQAGPLRWPVPRRFREPGDIVTFGYSREVVLTAEISPPKEWQGDERVTLAASVAWLVCREQCFLGAEEVRLELPIGDDRSRPSPARDLFASWHSRVPALTAVAAKVAVEQSWEKIADRQGVWTLKWTLPSGAIVKGKAVTVFPFDLKRGRIADANIEVTPNEGRVTARMSVEWGAPVFDPRDLGALVVLGAEQPRDPAASPRSAFNVRYTSPPSEER